MTRAESRSRSATPTRPSAAGITLTLLVAGILVFHAVQATQRMLSGLQAIGPETTLERWEAEGTLPTAEQAEDIEQQLEAARARVPASPQIHEQLARVSLLQLANDTLPITDTDRLAEDAAGHFRAALAARPGWAWTWGNLALLEYRLYRTSSTTFHTALQQALALAPYSPDVLLLVADLGLQSWDRLDAPTQAAVTQAITRGLRDDRARFEALLDDAGLRDALCTQTGASCTAPADS